MNKNHYPIFTKLMIAFFCVIVCIYSVGLIENYNGTMALRETFKETITMQVEHYEKMLSLDFERIMSMMHGFVSDSNLALLDNSRIRVDDYEFVQQILTIEKKLQMLKNVVPIVENASVFLTEAGRIISTEHSIRDASPDEIDIYLSGKGDIWNRRTYIAQGKLLFQLSYPSQELSKRKEKPSYVVRVTIPVVALEKRLRGLTETFLGKIILLQADSKAFMLAGEVVEEEFLETLKNLYDKSAREKYELYEISLGKQKINVTFTDLLHTDITMIAYFKHDVIAKSYNIFRWNFIALSLMVFFITVLFAAWVNRSILRPLDKLMGAFKKMGGGSLKTQIEHSTSDYFSNIFEGFNSMVREVNASIEQAYEAQILRQRAELKQLQYQINPHFLYNGLFLVHRLITMKQYGNAVEFTSFLRKYYQYITKGNGNYMSLKDEVEHTRNYIEIQTMRFRDRIKVELSEIPAGFENFQVPILILQPLIENAYEHGLKEIVEGGRLRVNIYQNQKHLYVTVEDNGTTFNPINLKMLQDYIDEKESDNPISKSTGIFNVHRRLKIKYGNQSGIKVSQSELGGLKVKMYIYIGGDKQC